MRTMVAVLSVVAFMTAGCATTGNSPSGSLSDDEQIAQLIAAWKTAVDARDVDGYLSLFSESYEDYDGMGKEALVEATPQHFEDGIFVYGQIIVDDAEITITGDTALVTGFVLEISDDTEEFGFALKKEKDGVWRIIGEAV